MADNEQLKISFGGCGFLGVYHAGVGKCVKDHAPHLFTRFDTFYGASAGAITAVCAACKSDPMVPYKWVKKTFEASRKYRFGMLHPSFDLYTRLRDFLEGFLPKNAHRLARGRVKISLTTFPEKKNWLVTDFNTRNELINAIIASSFIPVYAGFKDLPKFRGKRCCDGGFTSNIPFSSDPDVISVSPFSGDCDICPQGESASPHIVNISDQPLQISAKNIVRLTNALCPTSWNQLEELFHQGYSDGLRFFRRKGLIKDPVVKPLPLSPNNMSTTELMSCEADTTSDYFSASGGSTPSSHSRSQSLVGCELLGCTEDDGDCFSEPSCDSEDEWEQLDRQLQLLEERRGSAPLLPQTSSWHRLSWALHVCSPTNLPGVHRVCKAVGLVKSDQTTTPEEERWEEEFSGNSTVLQAIMASWPSAMVTF